MNTPIKLTPSEGKWLTQANLTKEEDRFFSDFMVLGINDKESNYTEWTDAQKKEWEEEHLPTDEPLMEELPLMEA